MPRFWPLLALFALSASGCSRSDIGSKAASDVVKKTVENEAEKAKGTLAHIGKVKMVGELIGSDPATGAPLWKLKADKIETTEQTPDGLMPRRAVLTGAKVELYRAGKLESTFNAPLIEFSNGETGLRLLMPSGVRASNLGALGKDGVPISITAPRGDVDVTGRLAALSGGATVVRGPITVTGQTLRTQTDLARSTLSGDVIAVSPQGKTRAKTATFAWKANRLSASNVVFTREDLTLSGAKLDADTASQKGTLSGDVRAKTSDSAASAPAASFDWKADAITSANATLTRAGATLQAAQLRTDSHLVAASASGLTIKQDGATLRAASADGFDGLARLNGRDVFIVQNGATLRASSAQATNWSQPNGEVNGQNVTVVREGTTLKAPRAKATGWSKDAGTFVGQGGVLISNARGTGRANSATWTGGKFGQIVARGGVEIRADGSVLRGERGQSDADFNNATLTGNVNADLQDGSKLRAPKLEKRGENLVASGGATAQLITPKNGKLNLSAPRVETTLSGQTARASGGVQLKTADGARASAPVATYNRATEKVTATGGVTYSDPARGVIKGESLSADLRLQSAVIQGVKAQSNSDVFVGKGLFN